MLSQKPREAYKTVSAGSTWIEGGHEFCKDKNAQRGFCDIRNNQG